MAIDQTSDRTVVSQTDETTPLVVRVAMISHTGKVRLKNEDSTLYAIPEDGSAEARNGVIALVADGMGGHAAGEVASQIAAQCFHYLFYRKLSSVPSALAQAFAAANFAIREHALNNPACEGMGTTCTALVVRDNRVWLGHIGDSRAYLIRSGKIVQISDDHSLVADLVRQGKLTWDEATTHPDRNVILKALGMHLRAEPTIWPEGEPLLAGDKLLLCSDGLTDLVDEAAIRDIAISREPVEACQSLIQMALDAGGHDNISVGVLAIASNTDRMPSVGRSTLVKEALAFRQATS